MSMTLRSSLLFASRELAEVLEATMTFLGSPRTVENLTSERTAAFLGSPRTVETLTPERTAAFLGSPRTVERL